MSDVHKRQQAASNPHSGVWVVANAGSGKTKVLTDRYLRLLLSGVNVEKILCITFTKAAAAEMKHRIIRELRNWSVMTESELKESLATLGVQNCDGEILQLARSLFGILLDKSQSLNIMTIHSFCQSLLGRFPLECGIVPHFKLAEESKAQELLNTALETVLDGKRQKDLDKILQYIGNNEALQILARKAVRERKRLTEFLNLGDDKVSKKIAEKLQVDLSLGSENYLQEKWTAEESKILKSKTDKTDVLQWLDLPVKEKIKQFSLIKYFYFTKATDSIKVAIAKDPELQRQATIIEDIYEHISCRELYDINLAFIYLCRDIINMYDNNKQALGRLDYDDLILKAGALLEDSEDRQWVAYKLDGGIDHILVDEAQDTNPEQWQFIKLLADSFFDNRDWKDKDPPPSLFVVGDEKQSIYRFQRADVQLFNDVKSEFADKARQVGMQWESVELQTSFRSSKNILQFVDTVFADGSSARDGLGDAKTKHETYIEKSGRIELLAPFAADATDAPDSNNDDLHALLQGEAPIHADGESKCAAAIAAKIKSLINGKSLPHAENRAITPGDIMILMRKRGAFMNKIIAALEKENIPVAGIDRLRLTDHIAVQDLLALADFCLLPQDDLTCAALLKSPFIGLGEDRIYHLCHNRKNKKLWHYMCAQKDHETKEIVAWLKKRIYDATHKSRYEFFASVLNDAVPVNHESIISGTQAFAARLGDHVQEILQEFLDYACRFESSADHSGSLQEFLHEIRMSAGDIKQETALPNPTEVRIMSIHAAKGLQSPIVILPDTTNRQPPIDAGNYFDFWKDDANEHAPDIPLWIPKIKCRLSKKLKDEKQGFEDQEYHRLLYVAMTRAESHLYIYGAKGKNKIKEDCWYRLIASACGIGEETIETAGEGDILFDSGKEHTTRRKSKDIKSQAPLPAFLLNPAAAEATPPRPVTASTAIGTEPAARSPVAGDDKAAMNPFERGLIIHSLLQYLPHIAEDKRDSAAENYLQIHANKYDAKTRTAWKSQVLKLMQNKKLVEVFSPAARSEVSVSGYINGESVSARIDRLLIKDDRIFIIDYKTSPSPPQSVKSVPAAYKKQMQLYKALLQSIYPDRRVDTALIWTHTAELMMLDGI